MSAYLPAGLAGALGSTDAMQAIFSDRQCVQRMLDVEAALARAEAQQGVIPASAVAAIEAACVADVIDLAALAGAAAGAGNLAIPLVRQLTAAVARADAEAAKFVHWGATSQDIIDTGLVLQLREALDQIDAGLQLLAIALADLAGIHRTTPVVARTWMQHALPTTFGLKMAGALDAVLRHQDRLAALRARVLVLQFGGAAGTLASLGESGLRIGQSLARELGLTLPNTPWHTQRDGIAEVATTMGLLVGTLGKLARDISLQMQTEVGEVAEPVAPGRGGSSTMPHKRNPVGCAIVLSAAVRVPGLVATMLSAMVQEHERGLGGWQAEWDTLPQILQLAAGALQQLQQVASGLGVDAVRMRANLDLTHGQIMAEAVTLALGTSLGRMAAHHLVEQACRQASAQQQPLRAVLALVPEITAALTGDALDRLLDPSNYAGQAATFVDRVLNDFNSRHPQPE